MPVATDNIRRWIEQSDIDYLTYFIKAWIPFNAWYNAEYSTVDSDRAKINAIKRDPNLVRNGINSYLEIDGQIGEVFRNHLAGLHFALLENQLDSQDGRIAFDQIVKDRNPINLIDNEPRQGTKYYVKRTDGSRLGDVVKVEVFLKNNSNRTIYSYNHTAYDLPHLKADSSYSGLTQPRQENLRLFYEQLKPILVINAIESTIQEVPKNYYKCDSFHFRRDLSNSMCYGHIVCKALVEILYQLRNILFHGEMNPTQAIQPVYRNAYFLLKMILEKIK